MRFEDEQIDDILHESYELVDAGRSEENLGFLREAVERFPVHPRICLWAAACLSEAGDEEGAMELVARATSVSCDDPDVLARAGNVAQSLDRVDELREYVERLGALEPEDPALVVRLAHLEGCLALFERRLDDAEPLLRAAYETDPTLIGPARMLVIVYLRQGRFDEARVLVEEGLEHLPGNRGLLKIRADTYLPEIGGGKAAEPFEPSGPRVPEEELDAILARADALREEGLDDECAAAFRQAVERFPRSCYLATRFATALANADKPDLAKQQLLRSIEIDPVDAWNLVDCALVFHALDDDETADSLLRRAAFHAYAPCGRAVDIAGLAGVLAAYRDEHVEAERYLRCAFEVEPEEPASGYCLAAVLHEERRPAEALEVVAEALRHHPGDEDLKDLKAQILTAFKPA